MDNSELISLWMVEKVTAQLRKLYLLQGCSQFVLVYLGNCRTYALRYNCRLSAGDAEDCNKLFSQTSIDLSNKKLEKLSNLRENYAKVEMINLSHNQFKFINNLSKFNACRELDVSFNVLERFSSFLPLANVLKHLDISHNVLNNCDNLAALTQLVWLDVAHNHIQVLPLLDRLTYLTYLNISNNQLNILPNLSKLPVLRILNLNGNKISTLDELHRTMPQCLQDLDIGANVIIDLREAQYLLCLKNIRSVVFAENPCVRLEGRTFCYRPYLYCCCLERLQIVDGKELSETEIIKGEELHTHAKIRRMETHAQLCAYLEKECPEDCHHSFSSDDNRLMKILKKRREYALRRKDDTTSEESAATTISPYREWLSRSASSIPNRFEYNSYSTEQKENCALLIEFDDLSSLSARISTPPTSANSNISSTVTLSAPSVSSSTPVRSCIQRKPQEKSIQVRKTSTITKNIPKKGSAIDHSDRSGKRQKSSIRNIVRDPPNRPKISILSESVAQNPNYRFISTENFGEISFVSARKARKYSEKEKKAASFIQSWWRNMKIRRKYRVFFLERRIQRFETQLREKSNIILNFEKQFSNLERNIEIIKTAVEQQASRITEMQKFLTKFVETCNERQKYILNKLLPVPDELQYIWTSETEVLLQWQNRQCLEKPTGYLITVDDHPCGIVRGIQKKALVTDLDSTKESVVRIQCVFNEFSGDISECLVIPSRKQKTDCVNENEIQPVPSQNENMREVEFDSAAYTYQSVRIVVDRRTRCPECLSSVQQQQSEMPAFHSAQIDDGVRGANMCAVIIDWVSSRMPLVADDLDMKYGVVNQNDVADKKKRKKSKGRTLEIDFPLHSNGLIQSYESSICYDTNNQKVVPAYSADISTIENDCSDVINQLLPTVRDAMQEFLYDVGNRACEVEEVVNYLKISDIALQYKQMLNSLNNAQLCRLFEKLDIFHISYEGSKMILQLASLISLRLSHQYLNGAETMGSQLDSTINSHQKVTGGTMVHKRLSADELLVQQNGDIFYDQNTELMDRRMLAQDTRFHLEKRFVEQRLKDVEKRYEERLSNVSLMLKKAYKEILDLRLGKAKALANKRMGQAELALKHANVIHDRIADETVKSDIKQMIRQWEQILRDYKAWHANLDRIVDGQKAQVDSNYRFDELALLSPPDNIPCAPQLPPNALKYFQQLEFECSLGDPSSELIRVIGPPVGFEKETVTGNRFGAIGQPAPPPQRKIFTEAQINQLVEKTLQHFRDIYGSSSNLSAEEIRNVLNELERRPLMLASDVTFSSVLSHIIKRVMEVTGANGGNNSNQSSTPCWTSLSSESSTIRRTADLENQECKICLQLLAHGDKLIQCPSCVDSYHYECGIKWLKQNSTCPHCRRLWSDPDDFPSLATATP
uniref:RING-type domain-containing protein n=1 Tax=Onchocerca volvulus TaxID=6282 RepID=A0A8R1TUL3_ONCVO